VVAECARWRPGLRRVAIRQRLTWSPNTLTRSAMTSITRTGLPAESTTTGPRVRTPGPPTPGRGCVTMCAPILSSCTPCSRCSRTPTSSTRARQDQRCSTGSSTSTMKSTAHPGGPCTRPRLPWAESLICTVHPANLRGPLRPTGGVDVPIPHCLRCERASSRHGELHRESVAAPALLVGLRVGQG